VPREREGLQRQLSQGRQERDERLSPRTECREQEGLCPRGQGSAGAGRALRVCDVSVCGTADATVSASASCSRKTLWPSRRSQVRRLSGVVH
jgi:hypothetical protein